MLSQLSYIPSTRFEPDREPIFISDAHSVRLPPRADLKSAGGDFSALNGLKSGKDRASTMGLIAQRFVLYAL